MDKKSKSREKELLAYYKYLYENYEIKSVSEIADYLDMHINTVRNFIRKYFSGQNLNGKFAHFDIIILTSTKFTDRSIYIEEQKKLSKLIALRKLKRLMIEQQKKKELEEGNQKIKTGKM